MLKDLIFLLLTTEFYIKVVCGPHGLMVRVLDFRVAGQGFDPWLGQRDCVFVQGAQQLTHIHSSSARCSIR